MGNSLNKANLRRSLADKIEAYMKHELRLAPVPGLLHEVRENPNVQLVEFAHTPHFGHLGFFRMLVSAVSLGRETDERVVLFIANDHVRADVLPTIRHIPIRCEGRMLDKIPNLGVSRKDRGKPLRYIPSPSSASLEQACEIVTNVLLFERSQSAQRIPKQEIMDRTRSMFAFLTTSAKSVESYAAWCLRSLIVLLREIFGPEVPILAAPSVMLTDIMPRYFLEAITLKDQMVEIVNRTNSAQGNKWPEWSRPKGIGQDYFPGWVLCDQHRDVTDQARVVGECVEVNCHGEQHRYNLADGIRIAPKVVLRQPLANLLGLEYRVCGYRLGYWEVADGLSEILFGKKPPQRFSVTGYVSFDGLGGLDNGPTALLRVLAEMSVTEVAGQLLSADPEENVTVFNPRKVGQDDN